MRIRFCAPSVAGEERAGRPRSLRSRLLQRAVEQVQAADAQLAAAAARTGAAANGEADRLADAGYELAVRLAMLRRDEAAAARRLASLRRQLDGASATFAGVFGPETLLTDGCGLFVVGMFDCLGTAAAIASRIQEIAALRAAFVTARWGTGGVTCTE